MILGSSASYLAGYCGRRRRARDSRSASLWQPERSALRVGRLERPVVRQREACH
jgi:hypothetical protein